MRTALSVLIAPLLLPVLVLVHVWQGTAASYRRTARNARLGAAQQSGKLKVEIK